MEDYWASYLDERERVVRIALLAPNDRDALRFARALVDDRARARRDTYLSKGIRMRIHVGHYRLLLLETDSGRRVYPIYPN